MRIIENSKVSFQAKALQLLLRISLRQFLLLLNLQKIKKGISTKFDKLIPLNPNIKREFHNINGQRIWKISGEKSENEKIIFYLHGGGFIVDTPRFYANIIFNWFCKNGYTVYYPQYPLLQTHSLKSIYNKAFLSYKYLMQNLTNINQISIVGDSAGGSLAFGCVQRIIASNLRIPDKIVAISPVADINLESNDIKLASEKDSIFALETLKSFTKLILSDYNIKDAEVNPIFGDFSNFPPTMIISSKDEVLYSAANRFAMKLKKAEIKTVNSSWHGLPHDFPLFGILPEAKKCRKNTIEFINS